MYTKIVKKIMEAGYSVDAANSIAEVITDYGWERIRDILNDL